MADYDVIIIGGNCPALTTAAYLGKEAGLKTLVLERSNFLGASRITSYNVCYTKLLRTFSDGFSSCDTGFSRHDGYCQLDNIAYGAP